MNMTGNSRTPSYRQQVEGNIKEAVTTLSPQMAMLLFATPMWKSQLTKTELPPILLRSASPINTVHC